MMEHRWLRLEDKCASGSWQMAADDWMLSRAEQGECLARIYTFAAPTVSLGYFQSAECVTGVPSLARLPLVRRMTGGDLLVHHLELTYAIAAPVEALGNVRDLPCRVHRSVSNWLARLGIETACQGVAGKIVHADAPQGMLCFLHPAGGDILRSGHKVMGSAQRKRRGAVLQHGSLLLGTSPAAPWLPGLADLGASISDITTDGLAACLELSLGSGLAPVEWPVECSVDIASLDQSRYQSADWNRSR